MFKQKHYLALGAVTLVTVLLLSLPSRAASRLKLAIGGLFLPFFGAVNAVRQLPGPAVDAVLPRGELLKEIENLRRENQQLEVQPAAGRRHRPGKQPAPRARRLAATAAVGTEAGQRRPA